METAGAPSPDVGRLIATVNDVLAALGAQRYKLGVHWISGQMATQDHQARADTLARVSDALDRDLSQLCREFEVGINTDTDRVARASQFEATPWVTKDGGTAGKWSLEPAHARAFEADLREARSALIEARGKRLAGRLRQTAAEAVDRYATRLDALKRAASRARADVHVAEAARDAGAAQAGVAATKALEQARQACAATIDALPAVLQPWTSCAWQTWTPLQAASRVRLAFGGRLTPLVDTKLGPNANFGTNVTVPWTMPLDACWFVTYGNEGRAAAYGFVRSLLVRHLASLPPGDLRLCICDPVALGQSAGDLLDLTDYDADLIGGKIWTTAPELDERLAEMTAHIELVLQKYLRTTYNTIQDFNGAAGEVAEPYRLLVLFDFPTGLTAESAALLRTIAQNGPRCGVFTVIAGRPDVQLAYGVDLTQITGSMQRVHIGARFSEAVNGYQLELGFEPDTLPEHSEVAKRVIDSIGRSSINRTESAVTFEKCFTMYSHVVARGLRPELSQAAVTTDVDDATTWWSDDSTRGLFAPIGQKGARDVAILGLDSTDHSGALLVGRPGSGKSTLLHTYIGGLTTLYGPDELELYLIDFKEGVEFKAYAEEGLPHARVVAVESDREFGLSVLESLQTEITRRAETLRSTGGRQSGMQSLREATGSRMPRILLVFDEFQVLFSRNDKIGLAAADLLESLIRQGRGFGIHVLLGSQSLAGLDALGVHVPQLVPVRILLPATESDARKVLGDSNTGGDFLASHGEGVLNSAGGAVEANERFRGALLTEHARIARLQMMRAKADAEGFSRRPMVFEGSALVALDSQSPDQFREELSATGTASLRIRTGIAMTVGEVGDLTLRREAAANALAILRQGDDESDQFEPAGGPAFGLLSAAIASVAMTNADVDVIDFMSIDDGLDALLESLLDAGRITLRRRRAFADVLGTYVAEVDERVERDDSRRPPRVLFLFGLHRARELDADIGSLDADTDLVDQLERVLRDGPEVGIHVWVWSDTVTGAARRLTARMMREFGWRIAGKMSADDSQMFLGSTQASDLRESQLLIVNDDRGTATRVTAFSPPAQGWLTSLLGAQPNT